MKSNPYRLHPEQSELLQVLRSEGALSRWQLHEHTGLRPNTVGDYVAQLLKMGVVCEGAAEAQGPGRPRIPVSIDPDQLHVVGAAIRPGQVEACRLNLLGQPIGESIQRPLEPSAKAIATLQGTLRELVNQRTFAIGVSTPGFLDPPGRHIEFSSATPGQHHIAIDSLLEVAESKPLVVANDMHALAARWLQEHDQQLDEDVLLAYFDDGQLGAAMLIRGEPNRGCIMGGNELGHTRFPVETEQCYCGHSGCLERIVSTDFLNRNQAAHPSMAKNIEQFDGTDPAVNRMIDLLASGMANQVNFIRPHRVVLVSQFTRHTRFAETLLEETRVRTLSEVVKHVHFQHWDQAAIGAAQNAAWRVLAAIYYPTWNTSITK